VGHAEGIPLYSYISWLRGDLFQDILRYGRELLIRKRSAKSNARIGDEND